MTDIVERLRALALDHYEMLDNIHQPLADAADEIERLRALVVEQGMQLGVGSVRIEELKDALREIRGWREIGRDDVMRRIEEICEEALRDE